MNKIKITTIDGEQFLEVYNTSSPELIFKFLINKDNIQELYCCISEFTE